MRDIPLAEIVVSQSLVPNFGDFCQCVRVISWQSVSIQIS